MSELNDKDLKTTIELHKNFKEEVGTEYSMKVRKNWGWELWFSNNDMYCGKLLYIERKKWSSNGKYHYHIKKDETFYVVKGVLRLDYIDEKDNFKTIILKKGSAFRIRPEVKHRFTSTSWFGCKFIEVSTTHKESDSYRVDHINPHENKPQRRYITY